MLRDTIRSALRRLLGGTARPAARRPAALRCESLDDRTLPAPMVAAAYPDFLRDHPDFTHPHDAFVTLTPDGSRVIHVVTGGPDDGKRLVGRPWVGTSDLADPATGDIFSIWVGDPADRTGSEIESVPLGDAAAAGPSDGRTALTVAALNGGSARVQVITFDDRARVVAHLSFYAAEEPYRDGVAYLSAVDSDGDGRGEVAVVLGGPAGPTVLRTYDARDGRQVRSLYLGAGPGWRPAAAGFGHISLAPDGADGFIVDDGDPRHTRQVIWATGELRDLPAEPTPATLEPLAVGSHDVRGGR